MIKKGNFIVVEGVDGTGKTTVCQILKKILNLNNIKNKYIREPGSTIIGEKIRKIFIQNYKENIYPETELLMLYASRYQLIKNVIIPNLNKGIWIIADRYDLSSQVYQNLNNKNYLILNFFKKILIKDCIPNIIFYLNVNPNICLSRLCKKKVNDRIENKIIKKKKILNLINKYKELIKKIKNVIIINNNNYNLKKLIHILNINILKLIYNEKIY